MSDLTSGIIIDFAACRRRLRPFAEPDTEVRQEEVATIQVATDPKTTHSGKPASVNPWWDDMTPLAENRLLAAEQRAANKMNRKRSSC